MKASLVAVAVAIVAGRLPAQTNLEPFHTNQVVTITNKEGKIFKDIKIVSIKPNAVTYVPFDGLGGGIINFKTLSNTDQKRFAYNQAKADEADSEAVTKQAAEATRQRASQTAALRSAKETMLRERLAGQGKGNIQIFQKLDDGLLIRYSISEGSRDGISMLVDSPMQKSIADGDYINTALYDIGTYTYHTAGGSQKTVRKYTASLEAAISYYMSQDSGK
jgi:hypothetical protein